MKNGVDDVRLNWMKICEWSGWIFIMDGNSSMDEESLQINF